MDVPEQVARQALKAAINRAYREDGLLFADDTHERTAMFRIGHYLATQIEIWGDWSVDLEYNRSHRPGEGPRCPKRAEARDDEISLVVPDLIVHKRGSCGRAANVLVLEAKYECADGHLDDVRRTEYRKLRGIQRDHDYSYAVYLEFARSGEPLWRWFRCLEDSASHQPPVPVDQLCG